MDATSRFALETHAGPYDTWPETSRLIVDGTTVDTRIPGFVIDGQYETDLGTLLLTSYACPFEEASAFTLLDARRRVLAQREIGAPYASYLLHAHWPIDARTLALHFSGEQFYTLRVQAAGRMPWQRHRIALHEEHGWRHDPRMRESHERLAVELEAIRASLDASREHSEPSRGAHVRD